LRTLQWPDRLTIAQLPTPIRAAKQLSRDLGVELLFKRDDLTGSTLTGNKVRKLEFLAAEAVASSADTLVTCGGEQSNHCRATAIVAAELGMRSLLILRTDEPARPPGAEANILLDRLVGADIRWVSRAEYQQRKDIFLEEEQRLTASGRRPYLIPEGGSNPLGAWGYVRCIAELAEQLPGNEPLTLAYATGSGGTGAGLLLGVKLLQLPWRVVGFNVCDDRDYFVQTIGEIIEASIRRWSLDIPFERREIEIVDGYVGAGYAKSQPAELATLRDVARSEGIVLDPVYTGKAFHGLVTELRGKPASLGKKIVFIHTGGVFGLFPKAAEIAPLL
jgi:D-cysteine desulfhydrase